MIKLLDIIKEIHIEYPKGYEPTPKKSNIHVQMPKSQPNDMDNKGFKLGDMDKDPITGREMQKVEYESSLSIMRKTLNKYHNSVKSLRQSKNSDIAKQAAQLSTILKAAIEKIKVIDTLVKTYQGK